VLAVPVAAPETLAQLSKEADEAISLKTFIMRGAIGFYYRDFHQMSDEEATDLLARAAQLTCEEPTPSERPSR
jgi:predicted phosphoribosyltransferase